MHGSLDKSGETRNRSYPLWGIGVFVVPVFVAIALVGLVLYQPAASSWIAAAAQAEFAGSSLPQETTSTLLAQPTTTVQTVRLY